MEHDDNGEHRHGQCGDELQVVDDVAVVLRSDQVGAARTLRLGCSEGICRP